MSSAAPPVPGRRRMSRALAEMHYQLRTGKHSPATTAMSVWLGTIVGCTPFYGLHLAICVGLSTLFGLSRVKSYLAAHVNNPLTLPFLLYAEATVGHWMFTGRVPSLSLDAWREVGALAVGRDLLVGSLVVGTVLGGVLALGAYLVASRWRESGGRTRLVEETARRYMESGIIHWEFVRGKLRHDPVYFGLLASGLLPERGQLIDLGCGRGILLSLLRTAPTLESEQWPADWPAPPRDLTLTGVDFRPKAVAAARSALGAAATITHADLDAFDVPACDAAVLLDVLHYLGPASQARLLASVARALRPGGVLLLREPDAGRPLRFALTRVQERICAIARRDWRQGFHYRTLAGWNELLERQGLKTTSLAMWEGTPYANVLVAARKPVGDATREVEAPVNSARL